MKRSPLGRRTPLKSGKPLATRCALKRTGKVKTVSDKRAADNRVYTVRKKAYLEAHPVCESCDAARSMDLDHITNRSQSSAAFLDEGNWQALCRLCHDGKGRAGSTVRAVPGWQYRQGAA